jgi:hypothetical protein
VELSTRGVEEALTIQNLTKFQAYLNNVIRRVRPHDLDNEFCAARLHNGRGVLGAAEGDGSDDTAPGVADRL